MSADHFETAVSLNKTALLRKYVLLVNTKESPMKFLFRSNWPSLVAILTVHANIDGQSF